MHLLICAATTFELEATQALFQTMPLPTGVRIQWLTTGVGLLPSAYQLTRQLALQKPQLVIQAGIGGCLDEGIPLCETVVVGSDTVADAGVVENNQFKTLFDLQLLNGNASPWTNGKLVNPHTHWMEKTGWKIVNGITVNEISTSRERIRFYKNSVQAQIESLEGAALHYVCLMEALPFLQVRTVSNYIGERNKEKWKLQESVHQLNKDLQQLLKKILEV